MLNSTLELVVNNDNAWNYQVVDFFGSMDSYSLKDKRVQLLEIVNDANKKYLVFNFQNLSFINSECISLLLHYNEVLHKSDKELVIVHGKQNVVDVLSIVGVFETMPYYKDLADFTKTLK